MENQEKVAEEQKKNPSSIDKYIVKLRKELEVWRESGDNHRSYIVIVCEGDGTKNEENFDGISANTLIGGNISVLQGAVYSFMTRCEDFAKVISMAASKFAFEELFGSHE